ncbi:Molybdenum transport ATP-binding protein ModC [Desulfurella amilsii]|uniref:Molybdenum transport ATP-binding protein ModC n=1 Tax=Desulfurella amilsii TaxID=1562698 RepID=A0A1X4XYK7_9BACT|nr:ABC transporter ATP-binding protein [Desulfurella amilsii]OSS42632.1 Molybdenum transport ATP-binding protein ModC [Desulfurella amilsii]
MNLLEVTNLNARFGSFKLKDINFSLKDNSILVILGKNGAGKTKLLECLCGLEPLGSGKIVLNNINITQKKPQERKIGYIGANLGLFPHMSIYENITYGLKFNKAKLNIDDVIEIFNLKEFLTRKPSSISSGQRQRVALARTLCANPDIILFDEPTSDISYLEKPLLLKEMKFILKKFNYACLFVTHDITESIYVADYIGIMQDGYLKYVQSLSEFLTSPNDTHGALFLDFNILKANRISSDKVTVANQTIVASNVEFDRVMCLIRPDMIILRKQETDMDNCFKCFVVDFSFNGYVYTVLLDCGFPLKVNLTKYYFDELNVKINQEVFASFNKLTVNILKDG